MSGAGLPDQKDRKRMAVQSTQKFYDMLSFHYDELTSFQKRFSKEQSLFRFLIDKYHIHTAIDAGCGTGFHSFLLTKLGVETTAVDLSNRMLQQLRHNSVKLNLKVKTVKSRLENLTQKIYTPSDAIFCLGNTIVHIGSSIKLAGTLNNFHKLLNPSGILVLQILNYDLIFKSSDRILNIRKSGKTIFIRFYDDGKEKIKFNVLTIEEAGASFRHSLQTTEIYPHNKNSLVASLKKAGFRSIKVYGGFNSEKYLRSKSRDLVITAQKL